MQIKSEYKDKAQLYLQRLGDVRFTGQLVFVVIVLLISWSGIKSIQSNYGLQKQIASLGQQNKLQKLANDNLKLQNEYYNSDQYLELAARQNFGLAAPGEKLVIVPENVALANTVELPNADKAAVKTDAKKPGYQRNVESWVNFFLNRHSD